METASALSEPTASAKISTPLRASNGDPSPFGVTVARERLSGTPIEVAARLLNLVLASGGTAGRIVEVVSGVPFDRFVESRLFGPLGMKDTTFYLSEEQLPRLATSYRRTGQGQLEATKVEAR